MNDNLNHVLQNYTLYIDSTSLMQGTMEFFKISLLNVLNSTNRQLKVVDFVVKDLRKKQFSDNERYAVKALNVLDYYRKRSLVEDIVTSGIEQGKLLNVIYNNRNLDQNDVCIITESKAQAEEIIQNLSNDKYVDFKRKIAAVHLLNGPALWDIKQPTTKEQPKEQPQDTGFKKVEPIKSVTFDRPDNTIKGVSFAPREEPKEETFTGVSFDQEVTQKITPESLIKQEQQFRSKRDKLVVSMVVDNSASMQGERATKLKEALNIFNTTLQNSDVKFDLDLQIIGFDGFSYGVIKEFDQEFDMNAFDKGGVQVLGKAMSKAMTDLLQRDNEYKKLGATTHRPWLIVLTDGDCYGDISGVAKELKKHLQSKTLTYFPFSLSSYDVEEGLEPLSKLKMFLKVKSDLFDDLLIFIFNTLQTRIKTDQSMSMTLDRAALSRIIVR